MSETGKADAPTSKDERVEFAKLPLTTGLASQTQAKVEGLLEQLDWIKSQKLNLQIQEDDMVDQLAHLQRETGRAGFRWGNLAFCSQPTKGRNTLDRMLLMEKGVSAAVIKASMKTGEPGVRNTFKRLGEDDE